MIINKELHPRSDAAQLYVCRKNGGWGFTGFENKVKSEENDLGWYAKNNIEPLLAAVRTSRTIHKETVDPKEFKKTKEEQRKNKWTANRMFGQFARDMENKDKNTWRLMRKSDLKGLTKLSSHPFVGCVVQEMRLYLI